MAELECYSLTGLLRQAPGKCVSLLNKGGEVNIVKKSHTISMFTCLHNKVTLIHVQNTLKYFCLKWFYIFNHIIYFKHFTSVNSHTGGRRTINNQLGVSKSPYTVGTFTDYSGTFNRVQESRINQMTLNMKFSLEVVSIKSGNLLPTWKCCSFGRMSIKSKLLHCGADRMGLDFLPICRISRYFVFFTTMPQCHYGFEALQMLPLTCFTRLIYSKDVSLPRGLLATWTMHQLLQ